MSLFCSLRLFSKNTNDSVFREPLPNLDTEDPVLFFIERFREIYCRHRDTDADADVDTDTERHKHRQRRRPRKQTNVQNLLNERFELLFGTLSFGISDIGIFCGRPSLSLFRFFEKCLAAVKSISRNRFVLPKAFFSLRR